MIKTRNMDMLETQ